LSLSLSKKPAKWYEDQNDEDAQMEFLPGPGYHLFFYKKQLMWMYRHSSDKVTTTGFFLKQNLTFKVGTTSKKFKIKLPRPFIYESIELSTFGREKKVFEDLFEEAKSLTIDKDRGKTKIFILDEWGSDWVVALTKPPRPLDSVVLDENLSHELLSDAKEFLSRSKWYQEMGLPYRRGYLFYGEPGCGK
jgi:mitochondrial chaperone BCS1